MTLKLNTSSDACLQNNDPRRKKSIISLNK